MKSFLNFFSEARTTKASARAKQLGLTGDGQGNWVDRAGNIVARTEGGQLVFTDRKDGVKDREDTQTPQYKGPEQQVGQKAKAGDEETRERNKPEEESESDDKNVFEGAEDKSVRSECFSTLKPTCKKCFIR